MSLLFLRDHNQQKMKSRHILAIGVSISLVILALSGGIYWSVWKGPQDVARATKETVIGGANAGYELFNRAGKDIYRALQFEPKVTIAGETVYGPAEKIREVATATKDFQHTYTYEVTWAGSKKRLELKGEFTAKAGFTVDESFSVEIAEDGKTLTLRHKQPELLSCELTKLHVIEDEDGWWNKLQSKEREAAQNELLKRARKRAMDADLQQEAAENLMERLHPLQKEHQLEMHQEWVP